PSIHGASAMRYSFAILIVPFILQSAAAQEPKAITNSIGMKLVRIEAGEFMMGQGDAAPKSRAEFTERDYDEAPVHGVKISQAFYLGSHEVTNAQFEAFDSRHKFMRGQKG